jgi:hypothetical protein
MNNENLNNQRMEILSISCSLVKAIDQYEETRHNLDIGPTPISDARASALIVANLAALEFVDDGTTRDIDCLSDQAQDLLRTLGVRSE